MSDVHGYGRYTCGCRCEVCRRAKAEYMRRRRAKARVQARKHTSPNPRSAGSRRVGDVRYLAPIAHHGTRYGYEEAGCRCPACTDARTESDRRRRAGAR